MITSFAAPGRAAGPPTTATETELMCLVKYQDDSNAWTQLLPLITPIITGRLRRALPLWHLDDGRADVLLLVWKGRKLYSEDRGPVRPWVATLSVNYARSWHRCNARQPLPLDYRLPVTDGRPDPAAVAEQRDWAAHVGRHCLAELADAPPCVRAGFVLRLGGMTHHAIANLIGCPLGTLQAGLFRLRTRVRARLGAGLPSHPIDGESSMLQDRVLADMLREVTNVKGEVANVKESLATLEQLLRTLTDPPAGRLPRVLRRLRRLRTDGDYASPTAWAELEDLVQDLVWVRERLPEGLYRRLLLGLKECRQRLQEDATDAHALNQLAMIEKTLAGAVTN